jgi:DNA-binding transcriptional MocR family regulator
MSLQTSSSSSSTSSSTSFRYDFSKGHPNWEELPADELYEVLWNQDYVSVDTLRSGLQYGETRGRADFRTQLRAFLQRQEEENHNETNDCDPNPKFHRQEEEEDTEFFITEGVSHGIHLLTLALSQPGDVVYTERPTYFLIRGIFHNHGLSIRTLPMRHSDPCTWTQNHHHNPDKEESQDCSVDWDRFAWLLEHEQIPVPKLVYVIPSYQNPSGRSMSHCERQKLATIAAKYHFYVVADEVYHLLHWRNKTIHPDATVANADDIPLRKMVTYHPNCISVSGFTKIFGPGIRCGWIEASTQLQIPHRIQSSVGYMRSQGGTSPWTTVILEQALQHKIIDRVLQRLGKNYQRRCNLFCDMLERQQQQHGQLERINFPRPLLRPQGGYFVWVRFPFPVYEFWQYCRERDVNFMRGEQCDANPPSHAKEKIQTDGDDNDNDNELSNSAEYHDSSWLTYYGRFCFAYLNDEDMEAGTNLLVLLYQNYLKIKELKR